MTVEPTTNSETEARTRLRFLWLEITGKCQLVCEHLLFALTVQRGLASSPVGFVLATLLRVGRAT